MSEEGRESWLARLCGLPLIGDWIATLVGLAPLLFVLVLFDEWNVGQGWSFIAGALALIPWLLFLEGWLGLRVNVPVLPIKWLWITPLVLITGVILLLE